MGWLRDAWTQAGFQTLDALATALHGHEAWPKGSKSPRTTKNRLGELARERGYEWWERKPARLEVMAVVIGWEPERLKTEIARGRREQLRPTTAGERFELAGLGRVRHLDLATDDLPPGVPELACRPARWRQHWWTCSDRRARELVGRWLHARGKAVFVTAQSTDELRRKLPAEGRVYALLSRSASDGGVDELVNSIELDDISICIAAPFSRPAGVDAPAWTEIASPALSQVLPELVEWVDSRIQARRRALDPKRLAFLGDDVDLICAGPCDLIDLLSFVAAHVSARKSASRAAVLQEYVARRGSLSRIRERVGGWLAKEGASALTGLMTTALFRGVTTWSAGLTRSGWTEFVPTRGISEEDVARVRQRLQGGESTASPETREELDRLLRPNEERVVDKLIDAEVLVQTALGCFEVSPPWLGQLARREALAGVFARGCGSELGALLLQPSWTEAVLDDMLERLLTHRSKRMVVSLDATEREPERPANIAFHEALFRVLGLAALVMGDIPSALLERVVRLQQRTTVPGPGGVPVPSISLEPTSGSVSLGSDGVFHLAALRLSERLPDASLPGLLSPRVLRSAGEALCVLETRAMGREFADAAFKMIAQIATPERPDLIETDLAAPAYAYLLASRGGADSESRGRAESRLQRFVDRHPKPARLRQGLSALDGHHGLSVEDVVRYLWGMWLTAPTPERAPIAWAERDPESRAWLWSMADASQRLALLDDDCLAPHAVDATLAQEFTDAMWEVWLARWLACCKGHNERRDAARDVFAIAPLDVVRAAIRGGGLHAYRTPNTLAELWRSRPEHMMELLGDDSFERAVHVAVTSPTKRLPEVLRGIGKWSEHDALETRALRLLVGWLRTRVRAAPEHRDDLLRLLREFSG